MRIKSRLRRRPSGVTPLERAPSKTNTGSQPGSRPRGRKSPRNRVECDIRAAVGSVVIVIVIAIADDGPGLTPQQIQLVHEPGRLLDEHVPGHGFGLPITRELAELYAGKLMLAPARRG